MCTYSPTLHSSPEDKDKLCEVLDAAVSKIPATELIHILGDFNARVGADHESWPDVLGHHGIGKMNENGERLLEFCCYHKLCVTNTFFENKVRHKVSWRHPTSKHWHQLDMILTRRDSINSVCSIRAFHSADCDTDHSLIAAKVKLKPRKIHHSKMKGQPRINTCKTAYPDRNQEFVERPEETLTNEEEQNAENRWNFLRNTIYRAAILTYGKNERKNKDLFEANITEMDPVINAKRIALINYKRNPNQHNLQALRAARSRAQQTARRLLAAAVPEHSGSLGHRKLQGPVWGHQGSNRKTNKEVCIPEVQERRDYHRRRKANERMGRTLPRPVLPRKLRYAVGAW